MVAGRNDGSPSIVVLLLSARSAEPPHSSGRTSLSALSALLLALRVATALPASKAGSLSCHPPGSRRPGLAALEARTLALPPRREPPLAQPVPELEPVGVVGLPLGEALVPLGVQLPAPVDDLAGPGQGLLVDLEVLVRVEPQHLLRCADLVLPERRAVRLAGVLRVRRRPGEDGAQNDERRPRRLVPGGDECVVQALDVLRVLPVLARLRAFAAGPVDGLHVPSVGLVPLRRVLTQGDGGVVLDRDAVEVV